MSFKTAYKYLNLNFKPCNQLHRRCNRLPEDKNYFKQLLEILNLNFKTCNQLQQFYNRLPDTKF